MGEFPSEAVDFGAISNITGAEKQRTDSIYMNLPYRRRKAVQEEVTFDRNYKKLEKVWKNRGLPVDRETLCSAASKDAFDMRSLNESLPSTSEKKPTIKEFRRKQYPKWPSHSHSFIHQLERFERMKNCSHSSWDPLLSGIGHRLFPFDDGNLLIENDIKSGKLRASLLRAQQRERWNRKSNEIASLQLGKLRSTFVKDSENSFVEMNKDSDLNIAKVAFFNSPGHIPLADKKGKKRKEHQNSDIENNHQHVGFFHAPVSKVSQDMNLCSSCDSKKNWIPNFLPPGNCPRFQSSNKKQENAYGSNSTSEMAEIRQNTSRELREQSKIRAMYLRRNVLTEDMNGSEIENPSIKIDSIISVGCNQNHHTFDISSKTDFCSTSHRLKMLKQKLLEVRETVKNPRSFRSRLSTGNLKSDTVVPD